MALGKLGGRYAFKADEGIFIDKFGCDPASRTAVIDRDWNEMIRLGGSIFFILKISAVEPTPIISIGAAQASILPEKLVKIWLALQLYFSYGSHP